MRTYKKRKNNTNHRTYKKTVKKSFRKTKTKKRNKTILKGGEITPGIPGSDSSLAPSTSGNSLMSMGQRGTPPDMGHPGMMPSDMGQPVMMHQGVRPAMGAAVAIKHYSQAGVTAALKSKIEKTDQKREGDSEFFTNTELIEELLEFKKQISDIIALGNSDKPEMAVSKVNNILDKLATQTTRVKGIGVTISREWDTIIRRVNRELKEFFEAAKKELKEFETAKKELKELIASSKKQSKKPKPLSTDNSPGISTRPEMSSRPKSAPPDSARPKSATNRHTHTKGKIT